MKRWFLRAARAYEREPELFLLAAGVVLAVVLWHLPVPAFLFADPGSGSATACVCNFPNNNCESWVADGGVGVGAGWEKIEEDATIQTCDGKEKKWGVTNYYYEEPGGAFCQNRNSCATHHLSTHPHYVDSCLSRWKRTVTLTPGGTQATEQDVYFKPIVNLEFSGMSAGNHCPNVDLQSKLRFISGAFADMKVCGKTVKDEDKKPDGDKNNIGWAFQEHTWKHDGEIWKFHPAGPWTVKFSIVAKKCACLQLNNAEQRVWFVCHVQNIPHNAKAIAFKVPAYAQFVISDDKTECNPSP